MTGDAPGGRSEGYLDGAALRGLSGAAGRPPSIAFGLPSPGELQFLLPVLLRLCERRPDVRVLIAHTGDSLDWFLQAVPGLRGRLLHVREEVLRAGAPPAVDVFATTEQYLCGLDGVYSVCLFHGQPSKGLTFTPEVLAGFDAFFLYGPLQRQAYVEFVEDRLGRRPRHVALFEIGYPKSDEVLNGRFARETVLADLGLDPDRPTVLYAPAFNEGASLREAGDRVISALAGDGLHNVIVKLPIECWQPRSDQRATGGVDWFQRISALERDFPRLRLMHDYRIDPLLAAADILVTCVSSVSFEFFALGKPVIFVDTPRFFSEYLQRLFPDRYTAPWAHRTTVNGGREFGALVSRVERLPGVVREILARPGEYPRDKERLLSFLLFNPGRATDAAVARIEDLLASRPPARHPLLIRRSLLASVPGAFRARQAVTRAGALARRCASRGSATPAAGATGVCRGFRDPRMTLAAAREANQTLCEYLESGEADTRKQGRRDRIIAAMAGRGLLAGAARVVEIGPGTGIYLERVIALARPARYEIYEPHAGWARHLAAAHGGTAGCEFQVREADGETLRRTASGSCDLVHAHAVFVYIPILATLSYLREASRVLVDGGHLVADFILDSGLGPAEAQSWLASPWRFPAVVPRALLVAFASRHGLEPADDFEEVYGAGRCQYVVFRKSPTM